MIKRRVCWIAPYILLGSSAAAADSAAPAPEDTAEHEAIPRALVERSLVVPPKSLEFELGTYVPYVPSSQSSSSSPLQLIDLVAVARTSLFGLEEFVGAEVSVVPPGNGTRLQDLEAGIRVPLGPGAFQVRASAYTPIDSIWLSGSASYVVKYRANERTALIGAAGALVDRTSFPSAAGVPLSEAHQYWPSIVASAAVQHQTTPTYAVELGARASIPIDTCDECSITHRPVFGGSLEGAYAARSLDIFVRVGVDVGRRNLALRASPLNYSVPDAGDFATAPLASIFMGVRLRFAGVVKRRSP